MFLCWQPSVTAVVSLVSALATVCHLLTTSKFPSLLSIVYLKIQRKFKKRSHDPCQGALEKVMDSMEPGEWWCGGVPLFSHATVTEIAAQGECIRTRFSQLFHFSWDAADYDIRGMWKYVKELQQCIADNPDFDPLREKKSTMYFLNKYYDRDRNKRK